MSKYTTELRYICEWLAGEKNSVDFSHVDDIIELARPKLFSFQYPLYDATHKQTLETNIIRHFYTREIGMEVYGLWKLRLQAKMNEIMPLYNQYYESCDLEFNPLHNVEMTDSKTEDTTSNLTGSDNRTVDTNSEDWNLYSATPQGMLEGVNSEEYLTTATKNTSETGETNNLTRTQDTVGKLTSVFKQTGKNSADSFSEMVEKWRQSFINVDMMIIAELEPLFMQLW